MSDYDSRIATYKHIKRVAELLCSASQELIERSKVHDDSKLKSPEKELFNELTPKLKGSTFGSEEYSQFLEELKPALDHHYKHNSHHPQHYEEGIKGMDLFDLIEMFLDWIASSERHDDGDIVESININQERFGYSDDLKQIMLNTVDSID